MFKSNTVAKACRVEVGCEDVDGATIRVATMTVDGRELLCHRDGETVVFAVDGERRGPGPIARTMLAALDREDARHPNKHAVFESPEFLRAPAAVRVWFSALQRAGGDLSAVGWSYALTRGVSLYKLGVLPPPASAREAFVEVDDVRAMFSEVAT